MGLRFDTTTSPMLQSMGKRKEIADSPAKRLERAFEEAGVSDDQLARDNESLQDEQKLQNKQELPESESSFVEALKYPAVIGSGIFKATQELGNFAIDAADLATEVAGFPELVGDERITSLTDPANVYQPTSVGGNIAREIVSFMLPFGAATKATKGIKAVTKLQKFAKAGAIGAAVDFAAFDPHEERLSNLVQKYPQLQNPVSEFLAANPKDSKIEGRFKNTLEGILLGGATEAGIQGAKKLIEGFSKSLKAVKQARILDNTVKDADNLSTKITQKNVDLSPEVKADDETLVGLKKEVKDERPTQIEGQAIPDNLPELSITGEELSETLKNISSDIPGDFAGNINLSKIKAGDDPIKVIKAMAKTFGGDVDSARRGVVSDKEVASNAAKLTAQKDAVEKLIDRPIGQAFNAEEMLSARILLNTSADAVSKASKLATGPEATKQGRALFALLVDRHRDIQSSVTGAAAEAGRALRQQQILAGKSSAAKARILEDIIKFNGGEAGIDQMASRISDLMSEKGAEGLGQAIARSRARFFKDALFESWINGILSRPTTQVINAAGNSAVLATTVVERGFGRGLSLLRGADDSIVKGETLGLVQGMLSGANDGITLAARVLRGGEKGAISSRQVSKIGELGSDLLKEARTVDSATNKVISSKRVAQDFPGSEKFLLKESGENTTLGTAIDLLGETVRLPGRTLLAADEFFKAVNMRGELHSLAIRKAQTEVDAGIIKVSGLQGRIDEIISNPSAKIVDDSIAAAKDRTFTTELAQDSTGSRINDLVKKSTIEPFGVEMAPLRIIAPFIRTPMNIISYSLERNPVMTGIFRHKSVMQEIAAGGARKDMVMAKLGLGATIMGSTAFLTASGVITGKGPSNVQSRKFRDDAGFQPYSIQVGDSTFSYDRFDPVGMLISMSADITEIFNELADPESNPGAMDLFSAGVALSSDALAPEMLVDGFSDFMQMLSPNRQQENRIKNFITKTGASVIPLSGLLSSIRTGGDPIKRETRDESSDLKVWDEMVNKVKDTIPGLSSSLPPKRNFWGEEISRPGIVNPFTSKKVATDPATKEITRLGLDSPLGLDPAAGESDLVIRMPPRKIQKRFAGKSVSVALTPKQYDRFVTLSAGIDLEGTDKTLKEFLNDEIKKGYPSSGQDNPSDETKKLIIKKVISSYKAAAKAQLLSEEESIINEFIEQAEARGDRLAPE